jgi:LacI family transcriptional regulator
VSIGTVDRALHNRPGISGLTRERVLRIAKDLVYTPHLGARALKVGRANLRIGVCIPQEIHFFYDQMRAGIFEEAGRAGGLGVEILYRPVPSLGKGERPRIVALMRDGVDALIVTAGNPRVTAPLIDEAEERGVRVICVSTDAPASRRSTVVCVEPSLNGRLAAELMAGLLPPASRVAVITGMLGTEDHRRKTEGFSSGFRAYCPRGKVVAVIEAHESEEESYEKTLELLRGNLAGLYVNTVNCLPVCRALSKRGLAGRVRLIATDLFREMVPHFESGTISASIYQDPHLQGQTAVRVLVDHFLGGTVLPPARYLAPGVVMRANLRMFREAT